MSEHESGPVTDHDSFNASSCADAELMDAIGQLHGAQCAINRRLLALIAEYDRREAYRQDGAASMAGWTSAWLGVSRRTGAEWARVASALESLPHIADAYGNGKLSFDQVAPLTTFATPEGDAELAGHAAGLSAAAVERAARQAREISDAEIAESRRRRHLRWRYNDSTHSLRLSGWLFDADGATVVKCLERIASQYPKDPVSGVYEDFDSRCADALVELCGSRLVDESDGDRATVVVHVDDETLVTGRGTATIENGPSVSGETVRRIACDSDVEHVVDGPDGKPVAIGRRSRKIPPYMMRALRHRDATCRFPGCNRTRWLHGHHKHHWAKGGATDLDNLVLLCGYHHRLVHEEGWKVRGDPWGRLAFVKPNGACVPTGPPPLRPEVATRLDRPRPGDRRDQGV